jgi:hypothetical protein
MRCVEVNKEVGGDEICIAELLWHARGQQVRLRACCGWATAFKPAAAGSQVEDDACLSVC